MSITSPPDARMMPGRWKSPIPATATNVSHNAKIGDAGETYAAQASCPNSCPFIDGGGCYAETGRIGKFVTRELNLSAEALGADALAIARAEAEAIDDLTVTRARPLRLHTVGDCASDEAAQIVSGAAERYKTRGGGAVWTYTHAWRDVARESWGYVSVLASCETGRDAGHARSLGYASAIVVEAFQSEKLYDLDGAAVIPCPTQTRGVHCSDCRLCFKDWRLRERGLTIGFELHGIPYAVRQARLALRNPDDPMRRVPSEQRVRLIRERSPEQTVREISEELDLNTASVYEWLRFIRGETEHPAERHRRQRAARR